MYLKYSHTINVKNNNLQKPFVFCVHIIYTKLRIYSESLKVGRHIVFTNEWKIILEY